MVGRQYRPGWPSSTTPVATRQHVLKPVEHQIGEDPGEVDRGGGAPPFVNVDQLIGAESEHWPRAAPRRQAPSRFPMPASDQPRSCRSPTSVRRRRWVGPAGEVVDGQLIRASAA